MTAFILQTPRGIVVISKSSEFPKLAALEPFVRWDSRDDHHTDYLEPYGLKPGEKK